MEEVAKQLRAFLPGPGPVPNVSPEDLRSAWKFQEELQASHPDQQFSIDVRLYQGACSTDADIGAVLYRLSVLVILRKMGELGVGPPLPGFQDGKPGDPVFKALAVVLMAGMALDDPQRRGLPLDVEELIRLIQN
jgi:hypothetical protein